MAVTLVSWASFGQAQNRSDVFLKNWDATAADLFRADGVTSLVPPSLVDKSAIAAFKKTVAEANAKGLITVGRIPLDYRIEIYEDFARQQGKTLDEDVCRDIEGNALRHWNGNIFLCSNSPFVREAMKRMGQICVEAGCDWISADLQTATHDSLRLGGCFCRHCRQGFAAYLQKPASWSYRDFLVSRGYDTVQKLKREAGRGEASMMPLYREYRAFQHQALRQCYEAIRAPGKKFLTSQDFHGHSAPLGTHPDFDFVGEGLWGLDNAEIPFLYALTEAAGRFNYITEGPEGDWENFAQGRLRLAQAYAYGQSWVVPYRQGIRRDGKWLKWISPPVQDLYEFIHEHRELFDGYDPWPCVGLIYSHLGHRYNQAVTAEAVAVLVRRNVPFKICVAGSDWWNPPFDLSGVQALVKTADFRYLTASQQQAVAAAQLPTVDISSLDSLWRRIPRPIHVSIGDEKVNVVPRRKDEHRLLHLVNMLPGTAHRDFVVTLNRQWAGPVRAATLNAPGRQATTLRCQTTGSHTEIHVPFLQEWAIITLE